MLTVEGRQKLVLSLNNCITKHKRYCFLSQGEHSFIAKVLQQSENIYLLGVLAVKLQTVVLETNR